MVLLGTVGRWSFAPGILPCEHRWVLNLTRGGASQFGPFFLLQSSLVAQMVNLPAMPKTQVRSLGWEDPLEKGMALHSSILAWRIPWTEVPGGLQSMESQRVGQD